MIRFAITVSLVPEARLGPFVYHGDLEKACREAAALGFDAVEIFPRSPEELDLPALKAVLASTGLSVAAVGTGAGWLVRQLHLTHGDAEVRGRAREFIRGVIRLGGELGAPAIIGSMQGKVEPGGSRTKVLAWLGEALVDLDGEAGRVGQRLLYEPLNRYETNLLNRVGDAAGFLRSMGVSNTRVLADLFHMNIEESDLAGALRSAGDRLGHIHFVDSNRLAPGMGHTDFGPVATALREMGYEGYVSAEAFPSADASSTALATVGAYQRLFPRKNDHA